MAIPRINEPVTGITGIGVNGTALVPIPTGIRLHSITLFPFGTFGGVVTESPTAANIIAQILMIQLEVGSNTVREFTPAELFAENALNNIAFENGIIHIQLSEAKRATVSGEESLAWPLYGQASCTVKVKYAADCVAPGLTASFSYDYEQQINSQGQRFLNVVHWLRRSIQVTGAGTKDENTLETGGVDGAIQRITLRSANVTYVQAKIGSRVVYEQDAKGNSALLKPYEVYPQANTFPIVFDYTQQVDNGLSTEGLPLALKLTHSGAGDYIALSQLKLKTFKR